MFSIGEFSRVTGLSIKTLRFYHDKGLLTPARVDDKSGYRYYDQRGVEAARVIVALRDLEFALAEIQRILEDYSDDGDILDYLEKHETAIGERIRQQQTIRATLQRIIESERQARAASGHSGVAVVEKDLPPLLVAGVRIRGKYSECGRGFGLIGRKMWRRIAGKPLCLYYDTEYKEDDADFEACMPLRPGKTVEVAGIDVRELPGGRCASLMHHGPYTELGRSYEKILAWLGERDHQPNGPTREVYHKGPGMIFRGNPDRYLTEIQALFA